MSHYRASLDEGIRFFEAGELGPAAARLQEIPDEAPERVPALIHLGRIYLRAEKFRLAEECFRTASLHTRDGAVFYLLGEALLAQHQAVPAEGAFREAVRREPNSASAALLLGRAVRAQGRLDEAMKSFERAISLDGTLAAARYYLTEILVAKGDMIRAVGQLHYLLKGAPDYVPAIVLKGDIAFRMKDYRQAIAEYTRAAELADVGADVFERLGHSHLATDDEPGALEAYEQAIAADPEHWDGYIWAARLAEDAGELGHAVKYYQAVADHPEHGAEATEAIGRIRDDNQVAGEGIVDEDQRGDS